MGIASQPSKVSLPQESLGISTVLDYLVKKFPRIEPSVWQQRMLDGKVHWHDGSFIRPETRFQAQQRVYYYREVEQEIPIPFTETILFQDEHFKLFCQPTKILSRYSFSIEHYQNFLTKNVIHL